MLTKILQITQRADFRSKSDCMCWGENVNSPNYLFCCYFLWGLTGWPETGPGTPPKCWDYRFTPHTASTLYGRQGQVKSFSFFIVEIEIGYCQCSSCMLAVTGSMWTRLSMIPLYQTAGFYLGRAYLTHFGNESQETNHSCSIVPWAENSHHYWNFWVLFQGMVDLFCKSNVLSGIAS